MTVKFSGRHGSDHRVSLWRRTAPASILGASPLAIAAVLGMTGVAAAQVSPEAPKAAPAPGQSAAAVDRVVVTGSFIQGSAEDAALPVDVFGRDELAERGSPSQLDFVKSLPFVGPVLGETNQYASATTGQAGAGTINLRSLGSRRTLVLLNGRRTVVAPGPGSGGVDTQLMPLAAIGRVEILKDGAAAVYGSDAIAGVANFITRRDLQGFEASVDYRAIDGSDGDYGASLAFGHKFDDGNLLISLGYQHRSPLLYGERANLLTPYLTNPSGYSSFGQPPVFQPRTGTVAVTGAVRDANCEALGSYAGWAGTAPVCYLYLPPFTEIVQEENRYQAYGEVNFNFDQNNRFHGEVLYGKTDIPGFLTSPSYPPTSGPNGPGSVGIYSVPTANPGAATALTQAGLTPAQVAATDNILLTRYRAFGAGGSPGFDGGEVRLRRQRDVFRVSGGLSGELPFGGLGYDVGLTYSRSVYQRSDTDMLSVRIQQALNGFGGPNCTGTTAGANGCLWLNPFSNGYAGNTALGLSNPGYVPANATNPALASWLFGTEEFEDAESLLVVDAVVNGHVPGFKLPGGEIGYAVGGQLRYSQADGRVGNDLADSRVTPCPVIGDTTCKVQTGPFIFRGQSKPTQVSDGVGALFTELSLPITSRIDMQAAVRYEDYGGQTGSTTNPKLAGKWQLFDSFALRGSVGTTFRGPTAADRAPVGATKNVGITAAGNNFKSVDVFGNPAVGPEKADTYNIGAIFEAGGLKAIVDYYGIKLKDQIVNLPEQIVATSVAGVGSGGQFVNCSAPLRDLITFSNNNTCTQGVTTGNDIQRVRANTVNGPGVDISGVDAIVDYDIPGDVFGGAISTGVAVSYVLDYHQDAFSVAGLTVSPAYEAVGHANYDRLPGTVSRYRANAYVGYRRGVHNLRATVYVVDGVTDNRATVYVQNGPSAVACSAANASASGPCLPVTYGNKVGSFTTVDVTYTLDLPFDMSLAASVFNLLDKDPPAARLEQSYDSQIANPLGRNFKISLTKRF